MQRSRSYLTPLFANLQKPNQDAFWDWLDSFAHLTENRNLFGLQPHDTTRAYQVGDTCTYDGNIYQALAANGPGAWNPASWQQIPRTAGALGIPLWDNATAYTTGQYVEYDLKIYRALTNSTGQQPDINPLAWVEVSAGLVNTAQAVLPNWGAGLWLKNQLVRGADQQVYRCTTAPFGISLGTDFAAELADGDWELVSPPLVAAPTLPHTTLSAATNPAEGYVERTNHQNDGGAEHQFVNLSATAASITLDPSVFRQVNVTAGVGICTLPQFIFLGHRALNVPASTPGALMLPAPPSAPGKVRIDALVIDRATETLSIVSGTEFDSDAHRTWPIIDLRTHAILQLFAVPSAATVNAHITKLNDSYNAVESVRFMFDMANTTVGGYEGMNLLGRLRVIPVTPTGVVIMLDVLLHMTADDSAGVLQVRRTLSTGLSASYGGFFTPSNFLNTLDLDRFLSLPNQMQLANGQLVTAGLSFYNNGGTPPNIEDVADITYNGSQVSASTPASGNYLLVDGHQRKTLNLDDVSVLNGSGVLNLPETDDTKRWLLTSASSTKTITAIQSNAGYMHPQEFECVAGLTVTFQATAGAPVANGLKLVGNTDKVINGANNDYMVLRPAQTADGVTYYWRQGQHVTF